METIELLCLNCICHNCPYGLQCHFCDRELDGHLLIVDGCRGDKEDKTCPLDEIAGIHASALRKIIKNQDAEEMKDYFDYKTGPWYNS